MPPPTSSWPRSFGNDVQMTCFQHEMSIGRGNVSKFIEEKQIKATWQP